MTRRSAAPTAPRTMWDRVDASTRTPLDAVRLDQLATPTIAQIRAAVAELEKPVDFTNRVSDELMKRVVR